MARIGQLRIIKRASVCSICGEATSLIIESGSGQKTVPCTCLCVRRRLETEEEKRKAAENAENERRRMVKAFGERIPRGTFDSDDGRDHENMLKCYQYAMNFNESRNLDRNGLFLLGEPRVGKTFAAEAVAQMLHHRGFNVLMDTAAGFVQRMQDREPKLNEKIARCDLLVVDDLGASRDTSFGHEAILTVVDTRISAQGPMIVTANVLPTADDITTQRLYGRIVERCVPLEFKA